MESFLHWWQHLPLKIDPVLLQLGPVQIRYYGLMYLTSFLVFYFVVNYRIRHEKHQITAEQFDGFLTWAILGIIVFSRLGYVLFYNLSYYISHPIEIFWPVQTVNGKTYFGLSGLSYHGGLIGGVVVSIFFCLKKKLNIWKFGDLIVPAVPLGYMFGRIGNFLNGELFGRVTSFSLGMYFSHAPTVALRHPSQLYEAFFEGLFLFAVLWVLRKHTKIPGMLLGVYLIGYGLVRFFLEYFREPDAHIGFVLGDLSMGQILCVVMVLAGAVYLLLLTIFQPSLHYNDKK